MPDVEEFLDTIQTQALPLLKFKDPWFGKKALLGPAWYGSNSITVTDDASI